MSSTTYEKHVNITSMLHKHHMFLVQKHREYVEVKHRARLICREIHVDPRIHYNHKKPTSIMTNVGFTQYHQQLMMVNDG